MYRVWVRIIHLTMAPTWHISELKYAPTHGTFPSFLEMDKTAGAYALQIYDQLKPNTAQDEGISTNSRTQHWRIANIWLAVTSSNALFLRRIAESSQPSIII